MQQLTSSVCPLTALPRLDACQPVFLDTRLQFTARPLCIERGLIPGRNYVEIELLAIDDWNTVRLSITDDQPGSQNVRHYVSFALAPAVSRQAKYKARSGKSANSVATAILTTTATETATRAGTSTAPSVLYGFVITELDMDRGTIYWACVTPWGRTGEVANMLSAVCKESVARVCQELRIENRERQLSGLTSLPPLWCIWALSAFDFATPAAARLWSSRGFDVLDRARLDPDFAAWERSLAHLGGCFPPERECVLSTACKLTIYLALECPALMHLILITKTLVPPQLLCAS